VKKGKKRKSRSSHAPALSPRSVASSGHERVVAEADLTDLKAQFTDSIGFSQLAAERSVVSF